MKIKLFAVALLATLSFTHIAFAGSHYYPPERIRCKLDDVNKPRCDDFNRQYLIEDIAGSDLQKNKDQIFHFFSAIAYYSPNQVDTSVVIFTYNDAEQGMVKLKTIIPTIRPDLTSGGWKKFSDEIYICNAGYMICSITNLPA